MVTKALAVRPEDVGAEDMIIRGRVTDLAGQPVFGAEIDIWHSTPDGRYSGIHDNIDRKYYHFWVRCAGKGDLINLAYFEGGDYVGDDCCETDHLDLVVPKVYENGKRVMQANFALEPAHAIAAE